jgi:heptosyltransferase I
VHAIPVLRLLKAHEPEHEIYWWISAELTELLEGDPDLSGLVLFDRRRWAQPQHWGELFRSLRQMRGQAFDLAIDLQGLARSGAMAWLARAKFTLGLEDWREGAPIFYDRAVPRPSPLTHAVDWYLEVLKALNVPVHHDFTWLPRRPEAAEAVQKKWHPGGARWVMLVPGARWLNKRWPIEYFVELTRSLAASDPDLRFAVLGARSDADLGCAIAADLGSHCLDLTGRTSIPEMIEWIRLSAVVVTNDTGPMHIAAALRKPLVPVFGPTELRRTGPYGQTDRVVRIDLPCAPCLKPACHWRPAFECLRAIPAALVAARVRETLAV